MFGKRETIVMTFVNRVYNVCQRLKYYSRFFQVRKYLVNNSLVRDSHKGEVCYVIGNGPSLKEMGDLSVLSERNVITVNTIMRSPLFDVLKSNYHIIMDPILLDGSASIEDKDSLKKLNGIDILVPQQYYNTAVDLWPSSKIWCCDNIYIPIRGVEHTDFTKPIYDFNNVLHWAILWAMYLGFERIVLLGADMTGFMAPYYNRNNISLHVYEYSDKEKQKTTYNNEWFLKAYGNTLEYFGLLREVAEKKGVTILNATPRSFLDMFPMVDFADVIKAE